MRGQVAWIALSVILAAGPAAAQTAAGPSSGVSLQVAQLESQIADLTAQIEQLQFENRKLREQVGQQLEDMLFRITELEGGDVSTVANPLETSPQVTAVTVVANERADLDRAKLDVQQGRFDQAEDRLRGFISDYPDSNLLGEAHYWLGQSQATRGQFQESARSFLTGYRSNQAGAYAAENMFQLGISLSRLGQTDAACQTLGEVTLRFPDASSSVLDGAASERSNIGC